VKPEATGQTVEDINPISEIIDWISKSDFLRFQQLEPRIGDPSGYPHFVDNHGVKGLSIYTALIHLDKEMLTCKLCSYAVEGSLEAAVIHQRVAHFNHHPYQCVMHWYVSFAPSLWVTLTNTIRFSGLRFASQAQLKDHQFSTGH
jgi:hypothetical protein